MKKNLIQIQPIVQSIKGTFVNRQDIQLSKHLEIKYSSPIYRNLKRKRKEKNLLYPMISIRFFFKLS